MTLPSTRCLRADRAARLAHRRAEAAASVPTPRTPVDGPLVTEVPDIMLTPAPVPAPSARRVPRNAIRVDEHAAQGLALAEESASLRERAARYAAILADGGAVDGALVESVLAAFRSYEPFLADRDRRLNVAAYRRLAATADSMPERVA